MSKETYIGGDYIEFTGGNNLSYAKEEIINSSNRQIIQKGENGGVIYGTNGEAAEIDIELTNTFMGRAIFKIINPLPTFVAQDYNKTTKAFTNTNRPYLPYGFDWYRDDWENLVAAEQLVNELKITDLVTQIEVLGQPVAEIKKLFTITTDVRKFVYKILHRIISGKEYLLEYALYTKLQGTVVIDTINNSLEEDSRTRITSVPSTSFYQIEELNLITGGRTGRVYKSNDVDLTNYNAINSGLERYNNLKTMKLLSSLQEMKKEYAPVFLYFSSPEIGSIKSVVNSAKEILKINSKEYYVAWFSAFNSRNPSTDIGSDVLMDIILDSSHSATGKVKVAVLTEDSDKISLTGDIETPVASSDAGRTLSKRINIKFSKPIGNHSVIEVRFFDDTKVSTAGYIGEIIGLLNVYKNDVEYKLDVQYVNVTFKGKIDKLPFADPTVEKATLNFNRNSLVATDLATSTAKPAYSISSIMTSNDLKNYVTSNINLFKNTLNQSLIKPNILPTAKDIEIDFGTYNFNSPPSIPISGIDKVKKSLNNYSYYDILTLKMNSDLFIEGLVNIYEAKYGNLDRGILIFFIPFSIVEPSGLDYSIFKGRVDKVAYDSKYLILARTLLEENAKEVPTHEVAHSLGLHHPFVAFTENSNIHHFIKSETLNVMDYPKVGTTPPIDFGIYLYKYQWDIILGDVKTASQRGDLIKINATDGTEIS